MSSKFKHNLGVVFGALLSVVGTSAAALPTTEYRDLWIAEAGCGLAILVIHAWRK